MSNLLKTISICIITTLFFACGKTIEREGYHTVHDKIAKRGTDSTMNYGVSSLDHLQFLETVKTDSIFTQQNSFLIPERKSQIVSYECSNCHTKNLDELKLSNSAVKKAHWDIELKHAASSTMECTTCHTANDMNKLHSLSGDAIDIDHSYKVCAQCHSTQYNDWKLGAHGKRLGGWAPPRVSNTCVNCHNPHKPGFDSRYPSRLNNKMMEKHRKGAESTH